MMKKQKHVWQAILLSIAILTAWLLPMFGSNSTIALASEASVDYPAQLMHIAVKDNSAVLTETGTADVASVTTQALGSDLSPSWRFDRVGEDANGTFFKLLNTESGRLLTPSGYQVSAGTDVIVYGSESAQSQHWYVILVETDRLGNDLYYKIVNYSDTSLALTQSASGVKLASYTGADQQLWLLNADGLQGFAGYCFDDNTGSVKASDIGGLFGEVVEVSTFDALKEYATSDTPYTIVITADFQVTSLTTDSSGHYYCPDGRIYVHDNKTIIGSYSAHTLYNVQFCTSSSKGTGDNLILKNLELQHDPESNGNDSIVVYLGSGQNLWVDHCTFVGHDDYNQASTGLPDWDKFLACCYDADYCTVSDCSFGLHEYGLILGYPTDDETTYNTYNNFPRMSLISNQFHETLTRGPGLMRYGYFHSLNNYVSTFSMAYTVFTASKIYAENCYYEDGGNVICYWGEVNYPCYYAESGSVFVDCSRTSLRSITNGYAEECTWRPTSNYSYTSLSAERAKTYCSTYSGYQSSKGSVMYLRYSASGVPSAGYTEVPSALVAASFTEGATYQIKNVNSGLYLQVADAAAENGANVQQWVLMEQRQTMSGNSTAQGMDTIISPLP
ncbi:MAG: RICIN domain-containing protein [Ruminococcus sp.]|nr:RICIN domain-containing protein [Ruminococcus sp.]